MKSRRWSAAATALALALTTPGVRADCLAAFPPASAKVRLLSCNSFTVQPSTLKMKDLDARQPDVFMDDPSSVFHGTLVQVVFDEVTTTSTGLGRDWKPGQVATLFTRQPAAEVCRPQKAAQVVVDSRCCDTFPQRGDCLVPGIGRVHVIPS